MNAAPDNRGNGRGHDAPGTFDPTAVLREIVAEIDDSPPWPDDADGPRLTFAELVEHEAMGYRAWGNAVGEFLARQLDEIGQLIRWTHSTTPDEHESRKAAWDDEIREKWEARGFEAGRQSCPCGQCPGD